MKWGIRRFQPYPKGHTGKGKFVPKKRQVTRKRQLAADKRTLDNLEKGGRARKGLTKNRQERMNEADKKQLKSRIEKSEKKIASKKKPEPVDISKMSNEELNAMVNRLNLEKRYNDITKAEKAKGQKMAEDIFIGGAKAAATGVVTIKTKDLIESILEKSS